MDKLNEPKDEVTFRHWMTLLIAGLTTFVAAMNTSVVSTVLPSLSSYFDITPVLAQWILIAYTLAYIGMTPLAGYMADSSNIKRFFLVGFISFVIASMQPYVDRLCKSPRRRVEWFGELNRYENSLGRNVHLSRV
jgi:hypothetical protein